MWENESLEDGGCQVDDKIVWFGGNYGGACTVGNGASGFCSKGCSWKTSCEESICRGDQLKVALWLVISAIYWCWQDYTHAEARFIIANSFRMQ
jgi:hypothetical protein